MQTGSPRQQVDSAERALRVDLAACHRLAAAFGWSELFAERISVRLPGPQQHLLVGPPGLLGEEVSASSLCMLDRHGQPLTDAPSPTGRPGFALHAALHGARPEIGCVLLVHSRAGAALSAQARGIRPVSQQSAFVLGSLGYHAPAGVDGCADHLQLLQDLGAASHLVLRNNALLTVGATVADAFMHMFRLQAACQIQLSAQRGGELIGFEAQVYTADDEAGRYVRGGGRGGAFVWPALLRRLDRIDRSYRD